ncbi:MAG TPA: UvrB/UvrC motif-containing protein [Vicinamibacteria bacterium]
MSGEDDSLLRALERRMSEASSRCEYEQAALYRDRAARFQGLRDEIALFRQALTELSFVYRVPSIPAGNERGYVIRRGRVVWSFSFDTEQPPRVGDGLRDPLVTSPPDYGDESAREEAFLVARWFRLKPEELARTTPLERFETGARKWGNVVCADVPPDGDAGDGDVEAMNRMAEA